MVSYEYLSVHALSPDFSLLTKPLDPFAELIQGRKVYHATPLHYLPSILKSGKLLSASASFDSGVLPRKTASRRDKMLGVQHFVHFALNLETPLLANKLKLGLPHAVLIFDWAGLECENELDSAILPFNTKAWRSRADASPVTKREHMVSILKGRDKSSRYPSLEYLVREYVDFSSLLQIVTFCQRDFDLASDVFKIFSPHLTNSLILRLTPSYDWSKPIAETQHYLQFCVQIKAVCPIPRIEFD